MNDLILPFLKWKRDSFVPFSCLVIAVCQVWCALTSLIWIFPICSQTWSRQVRAASSTPPPSTPTMRSTWPRWTSTALTTTTRWLCTQTHSTRWSTTQHEASWLIILRCVLQEGCIKDIGITSAFRFWLIYLVCSPVWQYPEGIGKYDYIPNFASRGLHYDIQKVNSLKSQMSRCRNYYPCIDYYKWNSSPPLQGLLMKIDAFHYIQPGTVYR